MKKILVLGATKDQIPVILKAKKRGHYVIVCSYNQREPGISLADEFYNISTTDKEAVLNLARKRDVDMVLAYASDAAGPTAAYVAERMGLMGNPYDSVKMMTDKDKFRSFLIENQFFSPKFVSVSEQDSKENLSIDLDFPIIVKPVDSSGGRGVSLVKERDDFLNAASKAFSFSSRKKIIIEEKIESDYPQVHGNGFVVGGELVFTHLGDHFFLSPDSVVPVATTWPTILSNQHIQRIEKEVGKIIKKSGFLMGPINIEARITKDNKISIIELAPRSAGNFVSELIFNGTGVDIISNYLKLFEGKPVQTTKSISRQVAYYLLQSDRAGRFVKMEIDPSIQKFITNIKMYVDEGDEIEKYNHMNNSIGIILFKFGHSNKMADIFNRISEHIRIVVK